MNINKKITGTELIITVEGRLDTITAPQLEAELKRSVGVKCYTKVVTGVATKI